MKPSHCFPGPQPRNSWWPLVSWFPGAQPSISWFPVMQSCNSNHCQSLNSWGPAILGPSIGYLATTQPPSHWALNSRGPGIGVLRSWCPGIAPPLLAWGLAIDSLGHRFPPSHMIPWWPALPLISWDFMWPPGAQPLNSQAPAIVVMGPSHCFPGAQPLITWGPAIDFLGPSH